MAWLSPHPRPSAAARAARFRASISSSDLTSAEAYDLAAEAASDESDACRALSCILFWTSAQVMSLSPAVEVAASSASPPPAVTAFERLCTLTGTDPCPFVRERACQLLLSLPRSATSPESVERVLHKRAEMPSFKPRTLHATAEEDAAAAKEAALRIEQLTTVRASKGNSHEEQIRADAAAAMATGKALREAAAGSLHLALEDGMASVRSGTVDAIIRHVWPDGPTKPACVPQVTVTHALGLLFDTCADQQAVVREHVLRRLHSLGPVLKLKTTQVLRIGACAMELFDEGRTPSPHGTGRHATSSSSDSRVSADSIVRAALALLGACRIEGKAALAQTRTTLADCLRLHPSFSSAVLACARELGSRHVGLVLGQSEAGLRRLTADYDETVAEGRAPPSETAVARAMLMAASEAKAAKEAAKEVARREGRMETGGQSTSGVAAADSDDDNEDADDDDDPAAETGGQEEDDDAAEAHLEASWVSSEATGSVIEVASDDDQEQRPSADMLPPPPKRSKVSDGRHVEANAPLIPNTTVAAAAAMIGTAPPLSKPPDAQAGSHQLSTQDVEDDLTARGTLAALREAAAALKSANVESALPPLATALTRLREGRTLGMSASPSSAPTSLTLSASGGEASLEAAVVTRWLELRVRLAMHVCEACAGIRNAAQFRPRQGNQSAVALLRLSYQLQHGFSVWRGSNSDPVDEVAASSALLPWLCLCRLWAHAAIVFEMGHRPPTTDDGSLTAICDVRELTARMEATKAAIDSASAAGGGSLTTAAVAANEALTALGAVMMRMVRGQAGAQAPTQVTYSDLASWLRSYAACVVLPGGASTADAQCEVFASTVALPRPGRPLGCVPQPWRARIECATMDSGGTSGLGPAPALVHPRATPLSAGRLLVLHGDLDAYGIPWRECVLAVSHLACGHLVEAAAGAEGHSKLRKVEQASAKGDQGAGSGGSDSDRCSLDVANVQFFALPLEETRPVAMHRFQLNRTRIRFKERARAQGPAGGVPALAARVLRRFTPDIEADVAWCTETDDAVPRAAVQFLRLEGDDVVGGQLPAQLGLVLL